MLHTRETFKRNVLNIYMYIYIAESFCCSLETTTTLFISYTPIQNVFVLKKNIKFKILKKKKTECGAGEDASESLGQQGNKTSQS